VTVQVDHRIEASDRHSRTLKGIEQENGQLAASGSRKPALNLRAPLLDADSVAALPLGRVR